MNIDGIVFKKNYITIHNFFPFKTERSSDSSPQKQLQQGWEGLQSGAQSFIQVAGALVFRSSSVASPRSGAGNQSKSCGAERLRGLGHLQSRLVGRVLDLQNWFDRPVMPTYSGLIQRSIVSRNFLCPQRGSTPPLCQVSYEPEKGSGYLKQPPGPR